MKTIRFLVVVFLGAWVPWASRAATFPDSGQNRTPEAQASRFLLVPTGTVPASENGLVEFGGPANAVSDFSVKLQQFAPGLYWVVMVRKSDGARVPLAPLTVNDNAAYEPDRRASDDPRVRASGHQVQVLETQAQIKLPTQIDLSDVAQILVEDVNGTALLQGTPARR